jgi:hypothetical protein
MWWCLEATSGQHLCCKTSRLAGASAFKFMFLVRHCKLNLQILFWYVWKFGIDKFMHFMRFLFINFFVLF